VSLKVYELVVQRNKVGLYPQGRFG
jgi:hypothetical protein